MIDTKFYTYDPVWLLEIVDQAVGLDPFLQEHPELTNFLKDNLPQCKLHETVLNPDYTNNVNFYFVDRTNANQTGSKWQFKNNIVVYGRADLIFDVLRDDVIGAVEVWIPPLRRTDLID